MKVLVSTDDGISGWGFHELLFALKGAKKANSDIEVVGVAPLFQRSGGGSSATLSADGRQLRYNALWNPTEGEWYPGDILSFDGTPIDCIKYGLWKFHPDWVIVGVNEGANIGRNILTSGTVCAAAYAAEAGIPAAAISQHVEPGGRGKGSWWSSDQLAIIIRKLLAFPPVKGTFYNVNLPSAKKTYRGTAGCSARGAGGYLTNLSVGRGGVVHLNLKWAPLSEPEKLLDKGYAVVQCFTPFASTLKDNIRLGGWTGDRKCAGGDRSSRRSPRSSRSSAPTARRSGRGS